MGVEYIVDFLTMLCSVVNLLITQCDSQASEYLMERVMLQWIDKSLLVYALQFYDLPCSSSKCGERFQAESPLDVLHSRESTYINCSLLSPDRDIQKDTLVDSKRATRGR